MSNKILYHGGCVDGFCSAWIAWNCLRSEYPDLIRDDFIPVNYGQDFNKLFEEFGANTGILLLDFSFKRPVLEELAKRVAKITIIDHHQTAEKDLRGLNLHLGNVEVIFDNSHSGAALTWKWFYPARLIPAVVDYVEDRDLWKWELKNSREISASIASYDFDFDVWDSEIGGLPSLEDFDVHKHVEAGKAILRFQNQMVDRACKDIKLVTISVPNISEFEVPIRNATMLVSEIGEKLSKDYPFSITWFWHEKDQKYVYSLRSNKETGVDVSAIAKVFGGGGHRNAAGFTLKTRLEGL